MTPLPTYTTEAPIPLPPVGTWPASVHRFDENTLAALLAAEAAGRPLLICGDPGTGKSQTARAAAAAAGRLFISVTIDGRTEAHDLFWQHDAVARLSDAQAGGKARPAGDYLTPGPLWWAFDWEGAQKQWQTRARIGHQPEPPECPPGWSETDGAVLLIDEIDKADPDLPNAFLEVLGNRSFPVPHLGRSVRGARPPLVVITSNGERELPNAFLRRCLVLTLTLPEPLEPWLVAMGKLHLGHDADLVGRWHPTVLKAAAQLLIRDRSQAQAQRRYAPGLAEYLDLVRALAGMAPDRAKQRRMLERIAAFALRKVADEAP
jgi:MoxR-like ATPase